MSRVADRGRCQKWGGCALAASHGGPCRTQCKATMSTAIVGSLARGDRCTKVEARPNGGLCTVHAKRQARALLRDLHGGES